MPTPAWLEDLGPVSAEHARAIVAGQPPAEGVAPADGAAAANHGYGDVPAAVAEPALDQPTPDLPALTTPRLDDEPAAELPRQQQRTDSAGDADIEDRQTAGERRRAKAWIRRILTDPITGIATNLDSRRRTFDGNARTFLTLRDRTCRQPFCSAPIRHVDHINPSRRRGPTSIDNGQGLCERGNYVKDMPGWTTRKGNQPGEVITTTPTGHWGHPLWGTTAPCHHRKSDYRNALWRKGCQC